MRPHVKFQQTAFLQHFLASLMNDEVSAKLTNSLLSNAPSKSDLRARPPLICSFPRQHQHLLLIGSRGSSTCSTRLQICNLERASVSLRSSAVESGEPAASCVRVADWASSSSSWLSSLLGPGLWLPARTSMITWRQSVRLCLASLFLISKA